MRKRKLTPQQVDTIFYLKAQGIPTIIIARTLQMLCNVALSATYHHVNKIDAQYKQQLRTLIVNKVQEGYTTGQIAHMINVPLAEVNKLYLK